MTKTLSIPQSLRGLNSISYGLIAVAVIYGLYTLRQMYSAGDKLAEQATKPIGQAWSDASAWLGGYRPVELTDLVIQPWYLDEGNMISVQAWEVLYPITEYRPILDQMFDNMMLKPQYAHLIGVPITEGDL